MNPSERDKDNQNKSTTQMVSKMINCLTISQYREFSEEGQKALDLIGCLDMSSKLNNKNECISYSDRQKEIDLSIDERFEIDVCLQHMLGNRFVKTMYKNVGVFEPKTNHSIAYDNFLNFLDTIIVRSESQKDILPKHLRDKTKVVRPACIQNFKPDLTKKILSKMVFSCCLGEETDKILSAYFNSFTINDNVSLAIMSPDPNVVVKLINEAKQRMRLFSRVDLYPEITIVQDIETLFRVSHCSIEVSGEYDVKGFAMYSIKHGNPIITLKNNPLLEWLDSSCYYLVDSHQDYAGTQETKHFMHSFSLRETMNKIMDCREKFLRNQKGVLEYFHKSFDYKQNDSIGEVLCSL